MKRLLEIQEYVGDVDSVAKCAFSWNDLENKTVLITGGTGLIGSFLVDVLVASHCGCRIWVVCRNEERARMRFTEYWQNPQFKFIKWNLESGGFPTIEGKIDYVIHLASNTHPVAYATDPIGTIRANVMALDWLLDLASKAQCKRFLFASSNEIYGENRGDVEFFDEKYCGYIDCASLRAGYPESKRCGEALCEAYIQQRKLDCVIARLTRTYGPTALRSDTKAINQFFWNALKGEDIVLKSAGTQFFSYQYVADSVSGLLTVLFGGQVGEAYNVASEDGDITLRSLAEVIAAQAKRHVILKSPNEIELAGFSKATKARLDGKKLKNIGWRPMYDIQRGVSHNYLILRKLFQNDIA